MMNEISTTDIPVNTVESSDEASRDPLLDDFRDSQVTRHRPNSTIVTKTFATPGFLGCDCVAATKRGRYNEGVCDAHKLTLRNSRPHLESIEFSQKLALLAEQNSPLTRSMTLLTSPKHPTITSEEVLDSVLLQASKSTSSLRHQHNFTSEASISLLPSLYPKNTARPRTGDFSENIKKKGFSLTSLAIDATTTLPLREAEEMLEMYNKIIRLNTETRKNLGIMYTRRSTLLAAMGNYSAALQDAEQVVLLDPKSTVVVLFVVLSGLRKPAELFNKDSHLTSTVDTYTMVFNLPSITRGTTTSEN
ncbi:hypothetical protein P3T76_001342 [Phytophthora citrophthora]|uniref:Uncharacterized protein n=1 Tax=Phytophthora citrophthora TaxID=4793 RepID=A0AAD9LUE7_9STRA|nr:hypothetical protein P3T76_001342 [Phytophthora citrophthora]